MSFRLFYILLIFAAVKCGEGIWAQEEGLCFVLPSSFPRQEIIQWKGS